MARTCWLVWLVVLTAGCAGDSPSPPPVDEDGQLPPPYRGPVRGVLAAGEAAPALICKGWLNGEPKPFVGGGAKAYVVDAWSSWCPHCRGYGPNLAKLYEKYHPLGVEFVSVTDLPKTWVAAYTQQTGVVWPSGYGLSPETLGALGTVNGNGVGDTGGYNVAPTIFVLGADGKVVGTDEQGRWHHQDAPVIDRRLDRLLDKALAAAAAAKKP